MVEMALGRTTLTLNVQGLHKVWALKRRIEIPFVSIENAAVADPDIIKGWWKGLRLPGTHVPGLIVAGTFYQHGKRVFWDVSDRGKAIIIDLRKGRYDRIIVDVDDPTERVRELREAIRKTAQSCNGHKKK